MTVFDAYHNIDDFKRVLNEIKYMIKFESFEKYPMFQRLNECVFQEEMKTNYSNFIFYLKMQKFDPFIDTL